MTSLADTIASVRSGVVRLALFDGHEQVGNGSGFLSHAKVITNSHVIRERPFDAVELTFGDQDSDPITPVRISCEDLYSRVQDESPKVGFDYAVLDFSAEPEFTGRHDFVMQPADQLARVGDEVLFFGFPFGSKALTSHAGHISASYTTRDVHRLQIDGSINPGNSGGPMFHLSSGKVIGIVTRTETGLERDFDELIEAISRNEQVLSHPRRASVVIGGLDPVKSTRITMTLLKRVARNLKRSANVGIGWAFCSEHVLRSRILVTVAQESPH